MKQETGKNLPAFRALAMLALAALTVMGAHQAARAQAPTPTPLWIPTGTNISPINTGNVGIGTTAPSTKLEVQGATSRNTVSFTGDGDTVGYAGLRIGALTTTNIPNNRTSAFILSMRKDTWYGGDGSGPSFVIETATKGGGFAAPFLITPTNDIILNSGRGAGGPAGYVPPYGNVGIGTHTPGFKLDVAGSINASGGFCIGGVCKATWADIGGSQWTTSGTSVYYNTGNVGVGTATPGARLDVGAGAAARGGYTDLLIGAGGNNPQIEFYGATKSSAIAHDEAMGGLVFYSNGPSFSPNFFIGNSGNVGVGTTTPGARLSVGGPGGNVYGTDLWVENNVHTQGNETLTQGGRGRLRIGTAWGYVGLYAEASSTGAANDLVLGSGSGVVRVGPNTTANAPAMNFLVPNGNVGIGTTTPSARLHLYSGSHTYLRIGAPLASQSAIAFNDDTNGQDIVLYRPGGSRDFAVWTATAGDSFRVTQSGSVGVGTATPGFKLDVQGGQINASGGLCMAGVCKATWADVGGGNPSQWANGASGTIYYSSGRIGVGTATPAEMLEVNGSGEVKARAVGSISAAIQLQESNGTTTWSEWQQYVDRLRLNTNDGTTTRPDVISVLPNGKVGIGKATPTEALDVVGNIRATGSVSATYQDVAEWVPSTQKLAAGTVVVLDGARANHVLASASAYDTKVAGVVSEQPGVILGVGGEGKVKVATTGRVRVKVDASRGAIKVGDLLVTSEVEGLAMKSVPVELGGAQIHRPGTIIGKALEPLEKGTGEILVLLSLQ